LLDVRELTLQRPSLGLKLLEFVSNDPKTGRSLLLEDIDQPPRPIGRRLKETLYAPPVVGQLPEGIAKVGSP